MTPGSTPARALGCCCSVTENNGGSGLNPNQLHPTEGTRYIVAGTCPLHGYSSWRVPSASVTPADQPTFLR